MKVAPVTVVALASFSLSACHMHKDHEAHHEQHKVVVTSPEARDVTIVQQYVCQIHSQRHINVRALQNGYLEAIPIKEGQSVKQGEVLFQVIPTLYQAKLDAELAEAQLAQVEYDQTVKLYEKKVVAQTEVTLQKAKLDKAKAKANLATAELNFTVVRAPFDGIVDRLHEQQGSLVEEGDVLTTLSDNSHMWVYFNVPEARYLEYKAAQGKCPNPSRLKLADAHIELILADGNRFDQSGGDTVTVEGKFNNETGNIPFRADFPNPDGLLRHGQTGTVRIRRLLPDALVIPQRATFEILDKRYVFVVGKDHVVRQREIAVAHELEDIFVVKKGLEAGEHIVLEGVRQVRDGEKVEYEFRTPDEALTNQKNPAE